MNTIKYVNSKGEITKIKTRRKNDFGARNGKNRSPKPSVRLADEIMFRNGFRRASHG